MADETPTPQQVWEFSLPDGLEGGAYSNVVSVWHTAYEFTLDFAVIQPVTEEPAGPPVISARVVSRIKFPPAMLFELMKALNTNMTLYEDRFGAIKPPEPSKPTEPPRSAP